MEVINVYKKAIHILQIVYTAAALLKPKQRLIFLEAVIRYALDGEHTEGLSGPVNALFLTIQPTLDTARKKAEAGAIGGSTMQALYEDPYAEVRPELIHFTG